MNIKRNLGGLTAAGLLTLGCGTGNFENRDGDIVAGEPATVLEVWKSREHTGKHGPHGFVLYLKTEDCPYGVEPVDGSGVNPDCDVNEHRVEAGLFRSHKNGDSIHWEGHAGESEVQSHVYADEYYYETVYHFALLVRQCIQEPDVITPKCVEDFVEVTPNTWYKADVGDVITFAGKDGKVVSQD